MWQFKLNSIQAGQSGRDVRLRCFLDLAHFCETFLSCEVHFFEMGIFSKILTLVTSEAIKFYEFSSLTRISLPRGDALVQIHDS